MVGRQCIAPRCSAGVLRDLLVGAVAHRRDCDCGCGVEQQEAHAQIIAQIGKFIGSEGATALSAMLTNGFTPASGFLAGGLSVGVILLGASGAFAELQQGLNDIWKVIPPPDRGIMGVVRSRGASFLMVLVVGLLLFLSLVLNATMAVLDQWFATHALFSNLLKPLHLLTTSGIGAILFAMIFKYVPDVHIAWGDVWMSAAATSLLFLIGQWVIALYLAHSAVASAFGAASSLVITLVWVYYSSQILFFGAELTKVYARTYGSLACISHQPPAASADSSAGS